MQTYRGIPHRPARVSCLLIVAAVLNIVPAGPAEAFWQSAACAPRTEFTWTESTNIEWDLEDVNGDSFRESFQDAFNEWRSVRRWDGSGAIYTKTGGNGFKVRWQLVEDPNDPDADENREAFVQAEAPKIGWATCGVPFDLVRNITFNSAYMSEFVSGQFDFQALAVHEIGHALGHSHSGSEDSDEGVQNGAVEDVPSMATCWDFGPEMREISQDDEAAAQYRYDTEGAYGTILANGAFEELPVTEHWRGDTLTYASGGVPATGHFAILDGSIWQDVRYTEGWDVALRLKAQLRKRVTGDSGYTYVGVIVDHGEYLDIAPNTLFGRTMAVDPCQHVDSYAGWQQNMNSATSIDNEGFGEYSVVLTCYPGERPNWTQCSSGVTMDAWDADFLEFRVYVDERMGGSGKVEIDRIRLQGYQG